MLTGFDPMAETKEQRAFCYRTSSMDEVSDPEEWIEWRHMPCAAVESEEEIVEDDLVSAPEGIGDPPVEDSALSSADPFTRMSEAEKKAFTQAENRFMGLDGPLPDAEPEHDEVASE